MDLDVGVVLETFRKCEGSGTGSSADAIFVTGRLGFATVRFLLFVAPVR